MNLKNYNQLSYYEIDGNETPVVFLHGLAENAASSSFILDVFPKHRILLIDLPGHGHSAMNEQIDIYEIAKTVVQLIQHAGISNCIFAGHSLGAQVAMLIALMQPSLTIAMVLISPAGFEVFDANEQKIVLKSWEASVFVNDFLPFKTVMNKALEKTSASVIKAYMKSMMERTVREFINQMKCPVLIFVGTRDSLIPNRLFHRDKPIDFFMKIIKDLPNFKCIPLEGMDHWPMFDNKDSLVKIMLEHLNKT